VGFGVTAIGRIDTPELPMLAHGDLAPPQTALMGRRRIFFEPVVPGGQGSFADTPVWARDALLAGNVLIGPAVMEEVSATTVLYPGDRGVMHESGSLLVELAA